MPKCHVCHEQVNTKKHHVYYYNDQGKKVYEHIDCADLIPIDKS